MDRIEAEALGFTVDKHCYPWIAYKGSRFNPTEKRIILTDRESMLANSLAKAQPHTTGGLYVLITDQLNSLEGHFNLPKEG
jgi:hypothetical protein